MIRAELFDAGSALNIVPWMDTPGMNEAYFREIDMEYTWPGEFQTRINNALVDTELRRDLLPWPDPFPGRCWVDWTTRYEGADGGLQIETARHDVMFDQWSLVPAPLAQIQDATDYQPNVDRDSERLGDAKTVAEISAEGPQPTPYLRLALRNEVGGANGGWCDLREQAVLRQHHHTGDEYRLVINYSPLFAPVDLRHPEWYDVLDANGGPLQQQEPDRWLSLRPDGVYRLYLRPANWRWVATVWANYWYVSWFESFPTRLVFTTAWFNRPPIYPRRHDLIHSTQVAYEEYLGSYYSTDAGIDYGFNSSRGAAFLRHQIIDSQWWTLSEAFIFTGNDPATLALWMWPPEAGDIVLGIGRVDHPTEREEVIWLRQNRDLTDEYPRTVIGSYIIYDFVVTT
jgi:hypothetical protein